MKKTTFTLPGKIGDALHQWPVAFWHHAKTGEPFDLWLDKNTLQPLVTLFEAQPGVGEVTLAEGIESYQCGGQPFHFNLGDEHHERYFVHLGMRGFPQRQITLQAFESCPVKVDVDPELLSETPTLVAPTLTSANRVVLHGQGICPHTRQTPAFWRFLARVRKDLEARFDEIVFVGSEDDRLVGVTAYPGWKEWSDDGDFLKLASYINASRAVLACGSSTAALAQQLKVPCVRVHDDIGGLPKMIWSGLGKNQLNATEKELRTDWREFRDTFLNTEVAA